MIETRESGVRWITINRAGKHNALSRGVLEQIAHAVTDVADDPLIRSIVLRGAGERFYAAGGDLVELSAVRDEAATMAMTDQARGALDAIRDCPIPVIAFLNGDAIGGGAELAVACDMRLQLESARIGYIQAKLAITSAWGGGPDLCQLVGASRAMRMMARAELIDAQTALAWGLADVVIRKASQEQDIEAFIAPILNCPAHVLRGIKAQTRAARRRIAFDDARALEQRHLIHAWLHEDHWAAAEALLSKGKK